MHSMPFVVPRDSCPPAHAVRGLRHCRDEVVAEVCLKLPLRQQPPHVTLCWVSLVGGWGLKVSRLFDAWMGWAQLQEELGVQLVMVRWRSVVARAAFRHPLLGVLWRRWTSCDILLEA